MTFSRDHKKQNRIAAGCLFSAAALPFYGSPRSVASLQYVFAKTLYSCHLLVLHLFAKFAVVVRKPNRSLKLTIAAKAGGLPQARNCSFNSKHLKSFIN